MAIERVTRANNAVRVSDRDVDGIFVERARDGNARATQEASARPIVPDQNFRDGKGRRVFIGMVVARGTSRDRERKREREIEKERERAVGVM